jgi:hypothetical protein
MGLGVELGQGFALGEPQELGEQDLPLVRIAG